MASIRISFDCNEKIGLGHFRRSLTLAQQLCERNHLVCLEANPKTNSSAVIPAVFQKKIDVDCWVFDCADNASDLIVDAKKRGIKTVALDYFADETSDLTVSVFEHKKPLVEGKRKSGLEYILIREDIQKSSPGLKVSEKKAIVLLGGGDIKGQSAEVALKFAEFGYQVDLIYGPLARVREEIENPLVEIHKNPSNLSGLMQGCTLAATNGGGCLFELSFLGKPVIVFPQTEEERRIAELFLEKKSILGLGLDSIKLEVINDKEAITRVSENGRNLIDGRGAERIAIAIEEVLGGC